MTENQRIAMAMALRLLLSMTFAVLYVLAGSDAEKYRQPLTDCREALRESFGG
jgi:hypothetical protein